MGLFRRKAKKDREAATSREPTHEREPAAEFHVEQAETVPVPAEAAPVLAETAQAATAETAQAAPAESAHAPAEAHREVMAESRPDPDQPGWGRALGQQIGKARENRAI